MADESERGLPAGRRGPSRRHCTRIFRIEAFRPRPCAQVFQKEAKRLTVGSSRKKSEPCANRSADHRVWLAAGVNSNTVSQIAVNFS